MNSSNSQMKLRLTTVDCNTSTKYYQITRQLTVEEKNKVKKYFEYYTKDSFENLENVAGKTNGWMCTSEDVDAIEKILE